MLNYSWVMSLGRYVRHDTLLECIARHVSRSRTVMIVQNALGWFCMMLQYRICWFCMMLQYRDLFRKLDRFVVRHDDCIAALGGGHRQGKHEAATTFCAASLTYLGSSSPPPPAPASRRPYAAAVALASCTGLWCVNCLT